MKMNLTEKFEVMKKQGAFSDDTLIRILESLLLLEPIALKRKRGTYKALIALLSVVAKTFFPKEARPVFQLISKKHEVKPTVQRLVSIDVSPDSDGKVLETGKCISCDKEEEEPIPQQKAEPSTNQDSDQKVDKENKSEEGQPITKISDARDYRQVLQFFEEEDKKLDAFMKQFEISSKASTKIGKAKAILKWVNE